MIKIVNTNDILEKIVISVITIFFACIAMIVADLCVLLIAAIATLLFGPQTYTISLETLMFMISAAVGVYFILFDLKYIKI